jgi:hypothetical protein
MEKPSIPQRQTKIPLGSMGSLIREHCCSGVLGTTHGGVRHTFVIQQYPESSPLELTIHSFFVQRPLLLLLESWGQRPPQKVPAYLSFTVSNSSPVSTLLAMPPYDVATLCGVL